MSKRYLTKSRFKSALECPTKLYYTRKDKEYADKSKKDKFLSALAEGGYQVGELAKYYHPNGFEVLSERDDEQLNETSELLKKKKVIIYEPAIKFENFFIRVDVLVKDGNNVDLIEVKAKSFISESEFYSDKGFISSSWRSYLYDIAFQNWVTKNVYPNWNITPFLMLADKNQKTSVDGMNQLFTLKRDEANDKSFHVDGDMKNDLGQNKLLTKVNVSRAVKLIYEGKDKSEEDKSVEEKKEFSSRLREYANYYEEDTRYPVAVGSKCKKCEFKNDKEPSLKSGYEQCWKTYDPHFNIKSHHIFDLWRFNKKKAEGLISRGIYKLEDLYGNDEILTDLNLKDRQFMQLEKMVTRDKNEFVDDLLYDEIASWKFPLHFIDFETSIVAIPFHINRSPYEQIAFQFSCHTLYYDGTIKHKEWIEHRRGAFPNYEFVKALKKVVGEDNGTIFRYATHENSVLRQIREQMLDDGRSEFSVYVKWIDNITEHWEEGEKIIGHSNMVDMLKLVKKYYYHPRMKGSNSIKSVLPAIFYDSEFIKERYSKPVGFGNNLKDEVLWKYDNDNQQPFDPYKILPDTYSKLNNQKHNLLFKDAKVQDGGAALAAFGKMQFTEMAEYERSALVAALLQYCELDTLAMVMLYQHWRSLKKL
jgi:hypothetical protein